MSADRQLAIIAINKYKSSKHNRMDFLARIFTNRRYISDFTDKNRFDRQFYGCEAEDNESKFTAECK